MTRVKSPQWRVRPLHGACFRTIRRMDAADSLPVSQHRLTPCLDEVAERNHDGEPRGQTGQLQRHRLIQTECCQYEKRAANNDRSRDAKNLQTIGSHAPSVESRPPWRYRTEASHGSPARGLHVTGRAADPLAPGRKPDRPYLGEVAAPVPVAADFLWPTGEVLAAL